MPVLPFRVVNEAVAEALIAATTARMDQINPIPIPAGPHAGMFAFSEMVMSNPAFDDLHEAITAACPQAIQIDVEVAWPPPVE